MRILVIVPAYNEGKNLGPLVQSIRNFHAGQLDLLVINDCSTDDTREVCCACGIEAVHLPCNLGIGGAVQTGYKYAYENHYDIAIQLDGDGQHKPEYIAELTKPIVNGQADLVIGSRFINYEGYTSTWLRRVGIKYLSLLIKLLTGASITDPTSGFRACNSKVISLFARRYPVDYPEPESIVYLLRKGHRVMEVPVVMQERQSGRSSITSQKSVYYMVKVTMAILIDRLRKPAI
jgi:Glycosyltransferases involved in cell wall biogenesis